MKPDIAIVGCGKVGTSLAFFLTEAGYRISALFSKTPASAEKTAQLVNGPAPAASSWGAAQAADVVLITTPDDVIADAGRIIAEKNGYRKNTTVLHCSGALPSTILAPAKSAGAFIGSMHPLQSFAAARTDINPFKGINMAVEGDDQALVLATQMAKDLGAQA
ncbi:MAG: NAD(P)-binding domain-containing protein, partial [Desulfobacterales bacterium]|nr:NAD(P)-binding domain-containing protein [Desulfobacterales bacterium]